MAGLGSESCRGIDMGITLGKQEHHLMLVLGALRNSCQNSGAASTTLDINLQHLVLFPAIVKEMI
jgi:hypothetical protein